MRIIRYVKCKSLLIIIAVYIFITISCIIQNSSFYVNIINPLFWVIILIYMIWNMKKEYVRFYKNKIYCIYMFIISVLKIIMFFYLGFILGFVKSPYNHKIIFILKNIIIQIVPIVSIEVARTIIINKNKNNKILIVFATIMFILVEIKYNICMNLYANRQKLFEYICSTILPLIANNILYTYLTLKGPFLLPLIYRVFNVLYIILSPIFPDIDWFVTGATDILSTTLVYILFKYKFSNHEKNHRKKKEDFFEKVSYILTVTLCISLVCFMLGLFKYEPITILSNSMYPSFSKGDVVIYKKISDSELKEIMINSIIIYNIDGKNIAHRVIDIIQENGTLLYKTKGDSNNTADMDLVRIEQVKGVYMFHIKYFGYPSVWLYDYFNN